MLIVHQNCLQLCKLVLLVGKENLTKKVVRGIIELYPNLRDQQGVGKRMSWKNLYEDNVVGDN
jgi:hypothetical protein